MHSQSEAQDGRYSELEAVLQAHEAVKHATIEEHEELPKVKRLVARVDVDPVWVKGQQRYLEGSAEQLINSWQRYWNQVYSAASSGPDFGGWDVPVDQMQDWLSQTVDRINSLRPDRLLEVGCGTGLLLERVAPRCRHYRGIDISSHAISRLRSWLQIRPDFRHVEVAECSAIELGADAAVYDTVVLNSVAQYFPNLEYFLAVVDGAVSRLRENGQVFLGDVANFRLLPACYTAMLMDVLPDQSTVGVLRQHLERAVEYAGELFIAPDLFDALPHRVGRIRDVEIALKRGRSGSLMSRYRYDVVLRTNQISRPPDQLTRSWTREGLSMETIASCLGDCRPASLRIDGIPNKRLARDMAAMKMITSSQWNRRIGDLRAELGTVNLVGEDPEDFWEMGAKHGYDTSVTWARGSEEGHFVAIFRDPSWVSDNTSPPYFKAEMPSWSQLATNPSQSRLKALLIKELWTYLHRIFPDSALPARIAVERLPVSEPSGRAGQVHTDASPTPSRAPAHGSGPM